MHTMDYRDKLISFVALRGPVLPVELTREFKTNIIIASAMLSELVSKGVLKLSHLKVGGSPVYYTPSQEAKLVNFIGKLNSKDQQTARMLQDKKILKDRDLDPLTRVSLRQIKDFARPLQVTIGEQNQLFWKWYLTGHEEAERLIAEYLGIKASDKDKGQQGGVQMPQMPQAQQEQPQQTEAAQQPSLGPREAREAEKPAEIPSPGKDMQKGIEPLKAIAMRECKERAKKEQGEDMFLKRVSDFLEKNRIRIIERNIIKRNSEVDMVISIPSPVGELAYACKARRKKRCSEADVNAACMLGQLHSMPVLFLNSGELTKGAVKLLSRLRNITVKRV